MQSPATILYAMSIICRQCTYSTVAVRTVLDPSFRRQPDTYNDLAGVVHLPVFFARGQCFITSVVEIPLIRHTY